MRLCCAVQPVQMRGPQKACSPKATVSGPFRGHIFLPIRHLPYSLGQAFAHSPIAYKHFLVTNIPQIYLT